MRKFVNGVSMGLLLGSLAACTTPVELTTIEVGPVVSSRPPSNIRRSTIPTLWRKLEIPVDKDIVRKAQEGRLTLAVKFSDCSEVNFGVSDAYVEGKSLYQSDIPKNEFEEIFASLSQEVELTAYIRERFYEKESPICAELRGGNEVGQIIQSQQYVLKPG